MSTIYELGNTIRLTARFSDWDDSLVIPSSVKVVLYTVNLTTYDASYTKFEEIPVSTHNDGEFVFNYVADREGLICYEWYADIGGYPSLQRDFLKIKMSRKER